MRRTVETTGRTVDDAVAAALVELGTTSEEVDVEILDEGSRALLGLVVRREARVRVSARRDKTEIVAELLSRICPLLGVMDATTSIREDEESAQVVVSGSGVGALIGRRGQTLDAVQYVANVVGNRWGGRRVPVVIDVDGYRARREETLRGQAQMAADRACSSGARVRLEPMSAYERRIVHLELHEDVRVVTESEGEEPYRRVVVSRRG